MTRRLCQYCHDPLGRFAKWLHIYTCRNCSYRMSMGTSPSKPRTTSPAAADERGGREGPWRGTAAGSTHRDP